MGQESDNENKHGITFEGGSGDSAQDPILIKGALSHRLGVVAEYRFIQHKYGRRNVDWKFKMQMLLKEPHSIDCIQIELTDSTIKNIYFDTSNFWGKEEYMEASVIDQVISHLEFLGYEVEKHET